MNERFREERGASAVLIGILLTVLLGFAALAVDVGAMYSERAQLQNAADAGALAAAQYCGGNDCSGGAGKTAARAAATAAANGNMLDATAGTTIPDTAFDIAGRRVTASTITTAMPHPFAAVIGVGSSDVVAAGTAQWTPAGAAVVPFAIAKCTLDGMVGGASKVVPIDNAPCPGSVSGGFGWLSDGTESCIKDVRVYEFTTITTGNTGKCSLTDAALAGAAAMIDCDVAALPNKFKSNVEKLFACFVGRTLYVPVFEAASKCPGTAAGKAYCITAFAAFEVTGVHTKVNGSDQVDSCKPGATCSFDKNWGSLAFEGRFIKFTDADESWMLGPPIATVRLVD